MSPGEPVAPTSGEVRRAALEQALQVLACPLCLAPLRREGAALVCAEGHHHDVARQGYASLAPGSRVHGDTAAMVAARAAFLAAGHFAAIEQAVVDTVPEGARWCLDLAAGTGRYLARVLQQRPALRGVALDVAPPAARAAAGAHERMAAATADVWRRLPVADGAADHLLDVFGPRNGPEFARALAPGGVLTVVTPLPGHLAQLRGPFGLMGIDADKARRTQDRLLPLVEVGAREVVDHRVLPADDVASAVLMGPNGHHLDPEEVRSRAEALGPQRVEVAVRVSVHRR